MGRIRQLRAVQRIWQSEHVAGLRAIGPIRVSPFLRCKSRFDKAACVNFSLYRMSGFRPPDRAAQCRELGGKRSLLRCWQVDILRYGWLS